MTRHQGQRLTVAETAAMVLMLRMYPAPVVARVFGVNERNAQKTKARYSDLQGLCVPAAPIMQYVSLPTPRSN